VYQQCPSRLRVGGVIANARKNGMRTLCICVEKRYIKKNQIRLTFPFAQDYENAYVSNRITAP
jgi:hypothetical protein